MQVTEQDIDQEYCQTVENLDAKAAEFRFYLENVRPVEDAFHKFERDAVELLEDLNRQENQTGPEEKPPEIFYSRVEEALDRLESVKDNARMYSERDFRELEVAMERYRVKLLEPRYIH